MEDEVLQHVVFINEGFNLLSSSILRETPLHSFEEEKNEDVSSKTSVYYLLVHDFGSEVVMHSKQPNSYRNQERANGSDRRKDIGIMFNNALCDTKSKKLSKEHLYVSRVSKFMEAGLQTHK